MALKSSLSLLTRTIHPARCLMPIQITRNAHILNQVYLQRLQNKTILSSFSTKQRSNSSSTDVNAITNGANEGILKKIVKKFGFAPNSRARLKVSAYMLYESVADKINYQLFFHTFDLPNSFNSWFLVTELHVWMLLVRAMAEGAEKGEDGRILRNDIVEALWEDVRQRSKKLGASNPSGTRQQIHILSQQFQATLLAYDEGVMNDDRILASALWRRFFAMDCDNYEALELILVYVRKQLRMLDSLNREDFLVKHNINWIPLTEFIK